VEAVVFKAIANKDIRTFCHKSLFVASFDYSLHDN